MITKCPASNSVKKFQKPGFHLAFMTSFYDLCEECEHIRNNRHSFEVSVFIKKCILINL